jgi:hypothetical protein
MSPNVNTPSSVDLAYSIALASYDLAQRRLEVVERRLQELLGFAVTISLGAIAVFSSKGYHFSSWLFIIAMLAGLLGLAIGTYARLHGFLVLIKPSVLDRKYLTLPEPIFKKYFVHFAGRHWKENAALINGKGTLTNFSVICFVIEIILLVLWGMRGPI